MLSQSSFCNQCLLNLSCLVDWIFLMKDFCLFIQVCSSVWSSEGLISISGILEFLAAKAANSPPHVLHQEPGPLRRWNAHTTREAHPAGLELLWILHGPGTWKEAPECRPVCYPVLELCPRRLQEPSVDFHYVCVVQEELAFVFEMLQQFEDALVQYDELDALFTQYVLNFGAGGT